MLGPGHDRRCDRDLCYPGCRARAAERDRSRGAEHDACSDGEDDALDAALTATRRRFAALTDQQATPLTECAVTLHELYESFKAAGFPEDRAFQLVSAILFHALDRDAGAGS